VWSAHTREDPTCFLCRESPYQVQRCQGMVKSQVPVPYERYIWVAMNSSRHKFDFYAKRGRQEPHIRSRRHENRRTKQESKFFLSWSWSSCLSALLWSSSSLFAIAKAVCVSLVRSVRHLATYILVGPLVSISFSPKRCYLGSSYYDRAPGMNYTTALFRTWRQRDLT